MSGLELHRLGQSAFDYMAEHGQRAVSAEVRKWVVHPKSVRRCGEPIRGGYSVEMRASTSGPRVGRLKQCRNRFVDPYCSGWWRAELADRTERAVLEHLEQGWSAYLLVHTLSHQHGDTLRQTFEWHSQAWNKSRAGRNAAMWRPWKWLKAADIVVGGRNGPHPHSNSIVLVPPSVTPDDFRLCMGRHSATWATATLRAIRGTRRLSPADLERTKANTLARGLVVIQIGSSAEDVKQTIRYGVKDLRSSVVEVHDNVHRSTRSDLGGFSLLELACMAHAGQDDAGRLLAASASDLAGKRSYSTSSNWAWAAGDLGELDEDADADALMVGDLVLGFIEAESYKRHRVDIERFCDRNRSLQVEESIVAWWEFVDSVPSLEVVWFDEPVAAGDL